MRAAVLGHPIGHSLSPVLHRAAYRALGLDWTYEAIDITEDRLGAFVDSLDETWAGLSLTMPLKRTILPLLDALTETVQAVGGANTVVLADGRRHGHNTDVTGIVRAVSRQAGDPVGSVGIIGAGATAAAAVIAAGRLGAIQVLVSARRRAVAEAACEHARTWGVPAEAVRWEQRARALACDVAVVTLPGDAGATLVDQMPRRPGLLLDVTYHPWPTTLAQAWLDHGAPVVAGHQMLLWQAAAQVELMTGRGAPVDDMADALAGALRS
jgi:shikimate dehydrogenase